MQAKSVVPHALFIALTLLLYSAVVQAAEIRVMSSGGFKTAYVELASEFERVTGHKVINAWGGLNGRYPASCP